MDLDGKIVFGLGWPAIAPVIRASVRILKSAPGIAETPVAAGVAVTNDTGFFTLPNCDVSLTAVKSIPVVPPPHPIGKGDFYHTDDHTLTDPWGNKVRDFKGNEITIQGIDVPPNAIALTIPPVLKELDIPVVPFLIIEITVGTDVFREPYPLPLPSLPAATGPVALPRFPGAVPMPGTNAIAPPLILINVAINVNINDIGGKNPFVDAMHQSAILADQNLYPWQSNPGLPGSLQLIPTCELPPVRYGRRGLQDGLAFTNQGLATAQGPFNLDSLDAYERLAPLIAIVGGTVPAGSNALLDDAAFAAQRLAGVNPLVISRLQGIKFVPAEFQTAGESFPANFKARFGVSLATAADGGKLYLCDYSLLAGIPAESGRFSFAPRALFYQQAAGGQLAPAGIFLGGRLDPINNPVHTPNDGNRWSLAKLIVQSADLNSHEMKTHLHDTHLVMEAMAVAMHRNLFRGHPISELLQQHFHVMFFQGFAARNYLMSETGTVATALGTGLQGSRQMVMAARSRWTFATAGLDNDLQARNMHDAPLVYPYRDDARDIQHAIQTYVAEYVNLFYHSEPEFQNDWEIQKWLLDAADPKKGNLGAMPTINTRADLSAFLSQIIFTCSAQHSAVNYPQYDYFGRVANMPGAIWKDPRPALQTTLGAQPQFNLLEFLPAKDHAVSQVTLAYQLTDYHYDQLGTYWSHDTGIQPYNWLHSAAGGAADRFKAALAALQVSMTARNGLRPKLLNYPYLLPENILNSISI